MLAGKRFTASEPFIKPQDGTTKKPYKVVIRGVPADVTEPELIEAAGCTHAQRIMKRDANNDKTATLAVILTYNSFEESPGVVNLDYLIFKTRPYVAEPM